MTQLNKILKSLETKKLIKAIKSVSVSIFCTWWIQYGMFRYFPKCQILALFLRSNLFTLVHLWEGKSRYDRIYLEIKLKPCTLDDY